MQTDGIAVASTELAMRASRRAVTNNMVFSTEDLVLIKVLHQGKGYDN